MRILASSIVVVCLAACSSDPNALGGSQTGGDSGGSSSSPGGGGGGGGDLQHCVDVVNSYRAKAGVPPLARSSAIEAYAAAGAQSDSQTGQPHGHFISTQGGGVAFAENEIPGWPLQQYGSIATVIDEGMKMMFGEGPGGGHYDNMTNTKYTQAGCGIYVTSGNAVWITTDFR